MKRTLFLLLLLSAGAFASVQATRSQATRAGAELLELPAEPQRSSIELVEAHPFELVQAETHWMRAEQESYARGTLLVLRAPAELWTPRQTLENPLYVGAETAEPINIGDVSGFRVVIVPGELDLAAAPIFLGEAALPERVTRAEAVRQLRLATEKGQSGAGSESAARAARPAQVFHDGYELRRFAAELVETYSPNEADLVRGLRAERL